VRGRGRIGINLLWMVPGVVGGSETYMTRLLQGLAERRSEDLAYTLFALPQLSATHSELERSFEVAYAPVTGQWKSFRIAGENSWLASQCRKRRIDLVHHAGGIVPWVRTRRPVVTIHDLQYLFFPEYFAPTKLAYLRRMVPRSAEAARLVLTPSEYSRRTVIERLSIDPTLVVVVPHGISLRSTHLAAGDALARHGLTGPYFLYPAASYPHKNHLVLLRAFAQVAVEYPDVALVLTGAKASMESRIARAMAERIEDEGRKLGVAARVKNLGYVPSEDLHALYRGAVATTFPSRFEGFGAPALEAMAHGCPVIAADASALPEVVGDAGLLVSPDNPDGWAQAMTALLDDENLRARLSTAGLERAAGFGWERCALILEESYRHALGTTL
jgi:glycosyltransferase involved in cell wall biosynthesis